MNNWALDDILHMHRMIWICTFCTWSKALFCLMRPNKTLTKTKYGDKQKRPQSGIKTLLRYRIMVSQYERTTQNSTSLKIGYPNKERTVKWRVTEREEPFFLYIIAPDKRWYTHNIFLTSPQKIYCGYSLEAPRRGASNEYPQHMFLYAFLLTIDHLISVSVTLLYLPLVHVFRHLNSLPYFIKNLNVQFTTHYCV